MATDAGGSPRQLLAILSTVTEQEALEHAEYFKTLPAHYVEQRPELEGLAG